MRILLGIQPWKTETQKSLKKFANLILLIVTRQIHSELVPFKKFAVYNDGLLIGYVPQTYIVTTQNKYKNIDHSNNEFIFLKTEWSCRCWNS